MKIAVPTNDGVSISEHFGRSAAFLIVEIEDGSVKSKEIKQNAGQHTHDHSSCGGGSGAHEAHNHGSIVAALAGCEVVICAGMGSRAAEALKQAGIREIIVAPPGRADEMVGSYLRGELVSSAQGFCRCSH
jgi:predicted Fe-Mo cluster-binding NifX family protein